MTREERDRRERLRASFDKAAELYDRARPRYPAALFEDLADLTGIGPGSRVLEIGPGTGQATLPLAERGCRVVAVELGPDLAAVARRNLARFPTVEVVTAAFEDWPLPSEPFDLVLAATAPARSSTGQAGSVPRRSAATNGSCRTPRPATSRSSSPTPATAPSTPRPRPACSTASPA
jgi:SAM-dependent methyltransferase